MSGGYLRLSSAPVRYCTISSRHGLQLRCAVDGTHPRDALGSEELSGRLQARQSVDIVQCSNLAFGLA